MRYPRSIAFKLLGSPPPKDAPRVEFLRWIRRFYLRLLPFTLAVAVVVLVWVEETWLLVVLLVSVLIGLQSVSSLSLRIRREEQRERR